MIERSPRWTATGPGEDIADPRFYTGTRHFEVWQQARRDHPIAWVESGLAGGFWSVTGHALGNEVLRQPGTFWSTEACGWAAARPRSGRRPAGCSWYRTALPTGCCAPPCPPGSPAGRWPRCI